MSASRCPRGGRSAGAAIVAATMAGALVFGLINHFIIDGSDHVAHVAREWRTLFGDTAALLVVIEAAGAAIGFWSAQRGAGGHHERIYCGRIGAIGVPLVAALRRGGPPGDGAHASAGKHDELRALGATPAVADALDAEALRRVVVAARPTHVIHQLTALPKGGPRSARDLEPTNGCASRARAICSTLRSPPARSDRRSARSRCSAARSPDVPADAGRRPMQCDSMESQVLDASRVRPDRRRRPALRFVLRTRDRVDARR